jgi:hypothetical protein
MKLFTSTKPYDAETHKRIFDQLAIEMEEISAKSAEIARGLVTKANGHMPKDVLKLLSAGATDEAELGSEPRAGPAGRGLKP